MHEFFLLHLNLYKIGLQNIVHMLLLIAIKILGPVILLVFTAYIVATFWSCNRI